MRFEPSNVVGGVVTWVPTMCLRLKGRRAKDATLQQKWKNVSTSETEWRDIELVHPHEED